MRKQFTIFLILIFVLGLVPINFSNAQDLSDRLSGKILLQVEGVGQAWYIDPETKERAFLSRPADAFRIMRELGLGISEENYNSFNGYAPSRLSEKILLRVEANGEAYYVLPDDLKLYYLGRPADAFQIMREKGLGITDADLEKVPVFEKYAEKVVEKIIEVPPSIPQKSTTKLSNSEIIEKVKLAVVYIQIGDSSGSGMIIESNGYILTNAHVVSGVSTAKIKLSDGRLFIGSVIGRDEKIDLAILKIKGNNLPIVVLGDSSINLLKQGDEVFSFGYPFGLKGDVSFKEGTISRRQIYEGITYLETSAEVHPGNSGGPLVNTSAQVIGVNTQAVGSGVGGVLVGGSIKFALPINLVRGLIPELKSGRNIIVPKTTPKPLPSTGQQEDSNLKIAKCQAEARVQADTMKQLLYKIAEDGFGKNIADAEEGIRKSKLEQLRRRSEITPEELRTLSPEQQSSIRESRAAAVQPTIDYYVSMKQKNLQLLEEAKNTTDKSVEQSYNELYLKCINK